VPEVQIDAKLNFCDHFGVDRVVARDMAFVNNHSAGFAPETLRQLVAPTE
jgi:hypothetical protein